ncbi:hypothetical protein [Piscinibacter sp.]|jgi:hypothetical protein|uniref:hypothetical protein n=1 Tax=Piscinibacter sp. TaxID=1903157 RepID=UPI0035595500
MSAAARTLLAFAAYVLVLGAALGLAPNLFLSAFGFATTQEPWIRLIGVLVLCLAFYYQLAARHELLAFIQATVPARLFVVACMLVLVGLAPLRLLAFGAIDLAGAVWTGFALRLQPRPTPPALF